MKKLLILLALMALPAMAEKLSVLNDQPNGKVYLNGVLIGAGDVSNHLVEPGEYVLTIKVNGETTYKESVYVGVGANTVVDTNAFVGLKNKSNIVDYGAKQVEEKRVKKATRGNIGIGAMASGAGSGISLKFHPFGRVGFQTIGWALKDGDESKYNLRYRGYYEIEDTLLGIDNLAIVYVGIGGGKISEKNGDLITGNLASKKSETTNQLEGFIGMEFSSGSNFFWNIEFGLVNSNIEKESYGGVKTTDDGLETIISAGGHFFFN